MPDLRINLWPRNFWIFLKWHMFRANYQLVHSQLLWGSVSQPFLSESSNASLRKRENGGYGFQGLNNQMKRSKFNLEWLSIVVDNVFKYFCDIILLFQDKIMHFLVHRSKISFSATPVCSHFLFYTCNMMNGNGFFIICLWCRHANKHFDISYISVECIMTIHLIFISNWLHIKCGSPPESKPEQCGVGWTKKHHLWNFFAPYCSFGAFWYPKQYPKISSLKYHP